MHLLGDIVEVLYQMGEWEIVYVYAIYNDTDTQKYRLREVTKRNNPIYLDLVPATEII